MKITRRDAVLGVVAVAGSSSLPKPPIKQTVTHLPGWKPYVQGSVFLVREEDDDYEQSKIKLMKKLEEGI